MGTGLQELVKCERAQTEKRRERITTEVTEGHGGNGELGRRMRKLRRIGRKIR